MNSNCHFESGNECSFISSRNNGSLADRMNGCETMLERALALWELGFYIFPAGSPHEKIPQYFIDQQGGDMNSAKYKWPKSPLIKWGKFQQRAPTEDEVRAWWAKWPSANIAIITGIQIDVVDADCKTAVEWVKANLQPTPWRVRTAKGMHFYYKRGEADLRNAANPRIGLDTRGEGGYVIGPGSTHHSGHKYMLEVDELYEADGPDDLPELTAKDVDLIKAYGSSLVPQTNGTFEIDPTGISVDTLDWTPTLEGGRNCKAVRLAGKLIADGDDVQTIRSKLQHWNRQNQPPMNDAEIDQIVRSVVQTHQRNNPGQIVPEMPVSESSKGDASNPGEEPNLVDNSWPTLISLDDFDPPSLNFSCLPAALGEYVHALSVATETPVELPLGLALAACATVASKAVRVMVAPGYYEPINLWLLVALAPGNRKSAVQAASTQPLDAWQIDQIEILSPEIQRISSDRKTKVARAESMRKKAARTKDALEMKECAEEAANIEADLPEVPAMPQLWTSDATPEKLGQLLADQNECMSWLSSEGGFFDMFQGRYSGGIPNLDLLLKSHAGDPDRVDRGSRPPVYLLYPRLTIGLSPQPEVLRGLAGKPGFRGRGLLARFLFLLPPSRLGYRTLETKPVPDLIKENYGNAIRAMLNWELTSDELDREQLYTLRLSPGAASARKRFALAIEAQMRPEGRMESITDWAGKAPGAAVRLAGVLHCIEFADDGPWEHEISEQTMRSAVELMGIFSEHALVAFDLMGADSSIAAARHVWDWVRRNRYPLFTVSEAFNALKGRFPRVQMVVDALRVLEERGYVQIQESEKSGSVGRPRSPSVLVRPELVEAWR